MASHQFEDQSADDGSPFAGVSGPNSDEDSTGGGPVQTQNSNQGSRDSNRDSRDSDRDSGSDIPGPSRRRRRTNRRNEDGDLAQRRGDAANLDIIRTLLQNNTNETLQALMNSNLEAMKGMFQQFNKTGDSGKPPTYTVKKLSKDPTPLEVEDWIQGITDGNKQKPGRSAFIQIQWALTQMEPEVQTDWRSYVEGLGLSNPDEEITLEQLWFFVRQEHVDPALSKRRASLAFFKIRQKPDQSPREFFTQWQALHRRLDKTPLKGNDLLAYDYWMKLVPGLSTWLERQNVPMNDASELALAAERVWGTWNHDKSNKKRGHEDDQDSKEATVGNVGTQGERSGNRRFSQDRYKSSRSDDPQDRPPPRCWSCGKRGHRYSECRNFDANLPFRPESAVSANKPNPTADRPRADTTQPQTETPAAKVQNIQTSGDWDDSPAEEGNSQPE
ncbi:hypothetical protein GGS26DRAFT_601882 [Hypomontagnella submonticulosa]|nr:hypothetical protein GGS26DRAFT_601882 [Hypomontagnella submonticulosa]